MIISLRELNKFMPKIKLDISVEKVINNLGYEVESVKKFSDVSGVKFAKILDTRPNPNSNGLTIVDVEVDNQKLTIQTKAKNAQKNKITVAFVEGSKKGDLVFKSKEMAGVVSQGMLSGFSELGFDENKLPFGVDDIILLNPTRNFDLSANPLEYFESDDYIFDITTPANRGDSNSYYVLAQEIAAYYQTPFKWFSYKKTHKAGIHRQVLNVDNGEAKALSFLECRFKHKDTKLRDLLILAKHNIDAKNIWAVDATNLCLIYTGVPSHVYDRDKIGTSLTCKKFSGKVTIIGGKEVEVKDTLAIFSDDKVVSLASVMGLEETSADKKSKYVVFEIGNFKPSDVRHGSKEIKIDTASSLQGGKILSTELVRIGMEYLKFKAIDDKQPTSIFVNLPERTKNKFFLQQKKLLAKYSGLQIKELDNEFGKVEDQLQRIGFKIFYNRLSTPTYRTDLNCYEDIIEEYFRFYGYDKFKIQAPSIYPFKINKRNNDKSLLQSMGYQEIRTFTLVNVEGLKFNPFGFENNLKLQTFVSKEREAIRNSIVPSMLEVAQYNIKRKMSRLNLFEYGMINDGKYVYGLLSNTKTFEQIKQDVVNFLNDSNLEFKPFNDNDLIHPNVSAKIYQKGCFIGWLGKTHPSYSNIDAWVCEIQKEPKNKYELFNSYNSSPLKNIDLTFSIGLYQSIDEKVKEIKNVALVFDIYQIDEFIKEDVKNVTLRVVAKSEEIKKINNQFNK
ncbi:phenylalanine--tRNA ligase subunit beta [Mycoplasmopsis caviae]|uniref:Phenylalanine--tRNA ligase beta subunit n=1 Tax=Mycoplasmopsis caviae TaxID=55603 RepID=A0A3P8L797_9BACT|nr:phenylalanine--tRNA ligase subunit beta [Mycoplasmopsis caviae]UUD35144.1 phenylalanine--tRNA ligase subunit beta [Mycoplasmopsis caviae]VDR42045.1 Phenylalanine--tRNA ligase beta subunit [Mycoplasmopsis caviae]